MFAMRSVSRAGSFAVLVVLLVVATALLPGVCLAAQAPLDLGTATSFGVLAGSSIVNSGTTNISGDAGGDVGVFPGNVFTGEAGVTFSGAKHLGDETASTAATDLVTAFDEGSALTPTEIPINLGGQTLTPGVYKSADGSFEVTGGALTLDAGDDPDAVFIFQTDSTFETAPDSFINLLNGARFSHVFWVVGTTATLGRGSTLEGRVLAKDSITVGAGATVDGQLLSEDGDIMMDTATINNGLATPPPPGIGLEMTADPSSLSTAGSVTYTYSVTNSGAIPLTNVTVTDDKVSNVTLDSGDDNSDSKLQPSETWVYKGTLNLTATTTNTGTAKGSADTSEVVATASLTVDVTTSEATTTATGGTLPDTDTPWYDILVGGMALAVVGAMGYWTTTRRVDG
jgi:uncharacterized repeat protein (TIGR01451 family)